MFLKQPLNRYIDHTLLRPQVMDVAFEQLLDDAVKFDFYSVCVSPYIAGAVVSALKPHPSIKVCTVVGFPHGNIPLELKLKEAEYFIGRGVHEIDWVLHYGEVLNENWKNVEAEIVAMGQLCAQGRVTSKCIVETAFIPRPEIPTMYKLIYNSQVDFIKTSTGYAEEGARLEDVRAWNNLRSELGTSRPRIKAAGGIKNAATALAFIEAGADRLGLSASVEVMEQYLANQETSTGREGTS